MIRNASQIFRHTLDFMILVERVCKIFLTTIVHHVSRFNSEKRGSNSNTVVQLRERKVSVLETLQTDL